MADDQPEIPSQMVQDFFGPAYSALSVFADKLFVEGEQRGLIGPRERDRIWSRHIVNCAALLPYLPSRGSVIDVGSGAGLPGLVIAAVRPDLEITLIDAMEKRCQWLEECAAEMGLANVTVIHGRSDSLGQDLKAGAVTARAVANMSKLIRITARLIAPGGALLALKGRRVYDELEAARPELKRYGLQAEVHEVVSVMDGEITYVAECNKIAK